MIAEKPVPDLIGDGDDFSDKIMRNPISSPDFPHPRDGVRNPG
jgi:hypothetical protein